MLEILEETLLEPTTEVLGACRANPFSGLERDRPRPAPGQWDPGTGEDGVKHGFRPPPGLCVVTTAVAGIHEPPLGGDPVLGPVGEGQGGGHEPESPQDCGMGLGAKGQHEGPGPQSPQLSRQVGVAGLDLARAGFILRRQALDRVCDAAVGEQ